MKQVLLIPCFMLLAVGPLAGAGALRQAQGGPIPALDFDVGNKQYEQGRYREAATTFESLLRNRPRSESLYYNLGNAWFKAGQTGRAIAAWRQAERLAPRDPSTRFNLQFARRKVAGGDGVIHPAWQRGLAALTLNEWTVLAALTLWLWFGLLALRELRPAVRPALRGYTLTAGLTAVVLLGCVGAAAYLRFHVISAVVVLPEAIARTGPLDEAKVLYQFRDGTELTVLDQKELTSGDQTQSWLQVRDSAKHVGWLKRDQVALIN
jgi:tetratricopeptide (TPR) repeat protein